MDEQEQTTQSAPPSPESNSLNANETVQKVKQTADKMQNIKGWSWGAFMLTPVFIIATKKYIYLLAYLLFLIPVLGPIIILGFKVYLGLNAKTLLNENKTFTNPDEEAGFVKGVNHAGFVLFILSIAILLIGFLFFGAILAATFSMFGGGMSNMGGYR